jgi:predicted RNA-binding protein with TRAM domain
VKIPAAFLSLLAVSIALPALAGEVVRLSEPVEVGEGYEVFGSPVGAAGEPVALAEVVADSDAYAGKQVKVKAKVAQVCQKKGCFLVAHDGDAVARVTFVDYSFFVPTDSGGKDVTVVGTFNRRTITEAQARHFAEDVGDDPSKIVGSRDEYFIVATSVVVPTS